MMSTHGVIILHVVKQIKRSVIYLISQHIIQTAIGSMNLHFFGPTKKGNSNGYIPEKGADKN